LDAASQLKRGIAKKACRRKGKYKLRIERRKKWLSKETMYSTHCYKCPGKEEHRK
jgi:hypothetical protein